MAALLHVLAAMTHMDAAMARTCGTNLHMVAAMAHVDGAMALVDPDENARKRLQSYEASMPRCSVQSSLAHTP